MKILLLLIADEVPDALRNRLKEQGILLIGLAGLFEAGKFSNPSE